MNRTRGRILIATCLILITGAVAMATMTRDRSRLPIGRAHLSGDQEVPPVDTDAQGQALFYHNDDGTLGFKVNVANIENVTQSHIHCGEAGLNGPVVTFLFGFVTGGVTVNGILAEGTIAESNIIPRPDSVACPGGVSNMNDLLFKIRNGGAYVNVHTIQNPPGEVRGQIAAQQ